MLYLIGLGLNEESISQEGFNVINKSKKVYIENYTVNFPYSFDKLEENLRTKIIQIGREEVEDNKIIEEAKNEDISLLVYGSPLTATTHISLIQEAKDKGVKYHIIYNGSIFDAIAESGLQIYKFGKITSMPKWTKSFTPKSFMEVIIQNKKIDAHSLILIDIGLEIKEAIEELKEASKKYEVEFEKIIVCSSLGTKQGKIIYDKIDNIIKLEIKKPYCIIIPSKLHFAEEEFLNKV